MQGKRLSMAKRLTFVGTGEGAEQLLKQKYALTQTTAREVCSTAG